MKTKLTVEIEYDPTTTDPEGLASAMDRLMETALSTPDILDDYGNPTVGEFFVANPGRAKAVNEPKQYALQIDGPLFRAQQQLLFKIADLVRRKRTYKPTSADEALLEGLLGLTDEIADQAHDRHGINCLLNKEDDC